MLPLGWKPFPSVAAPSGRALTLPPGFGGESARDCGETPLTEVGLQDGGGGGAETAMGSMGGDLASTSQGRVVRLPELLCGITTEPIAPGGAVTATEDWCLTAIVGDPWPGACEKTAEDTSRGEPGAMAVVEKVTGRCTEA